MQQSIPAQAAQPCMGLGLHWWPPGFGCPSLLWCWTESMLPPSECWPFCEKEVGETWPGRQHPAQPASAHLSQSQCCRWHGVQGSVGKVRGRVRKRETMGKNRSSTLPLHRKATQMIYTYDDRQDFKAKQLHQARNQASFDHHLNALIRAICQVWNSPTCVSQHLLVIVV